MLCETKSSIAFNIKLQFCFQLSQARQENIDPDLPPSYNELVFVIPVDNNETGQDTTNVNRYNIQYFRKVYN